jgi:uncharacterized protein involved in exopolysaccharide biosynthesis
MHMTVNPRHAAPPTANQPSEDDVGILSFVNVLLRRRDTVLGWMLVGALVAVGFALLSHRTYTVMAAFMPQAKRGGSTLSGIAAQFGFVVPIGESGPTPAFYVDLINSRPLLGSLVDTRFSYQADTGAASGTLVELYRSRGRTAPLRRDAAIRRAGKNVNASARPKTGVVRLEVTATDPDLATQMTRRIVELVNTFNVETRQSQAAAERRFAEQRKQEVARDLRSAEDRLQAFLQRNRDYRNSPELSFQQDRLSREVSMQQELYNSLAQAYEQAKLDEVRDTPVLTVVEAPMPPVRPDSRGLLKKGLAGLLVAGVLGMGLAFIREAAGRLGDQNQPEVGEFRRLSRQFKSDLRRPWLPIRRWLRLG